MYFDLDLVTYLLEQAALQPPLHQKKVPRQSMFGMVVKATLYNVDTVVQ